MKLSFNLKLSQSLKLTPLLQQSIKFLQASQAELNDLVEEYLADNIFLEPDEESDTSLNKNYKNIKNNNPSNENHYDIFERQTKNQTLREYLIENLAIFTFSDREQVIFTFLIDAIDEQGYLSENIEQIMDNIPLIPTIKIDEIEKLLKLIQNSTLPGIGARNLSECLTLQLNIIQDNSRKLNLAKEIVNHHLELLAKNKNKELKIKLKCNDNELHESIGLIKILNPKPGASFQKINKSDYIITDVILKKSNNQWNVFLNDDNFFKLKINKNYEQYLSKDPNSDLKEKFQEAKWLIKNLQQRSVSILRVSRAIIEKQQEFVEKGKLFLKPLILKDIATELEFHESTISRLTSNKFITTPHGVFELKYFFGSTIKTKDSSDLSSKAVLSRIKELVDSEPKNKPYSDEKLCLLLSKQGVKMARRTVTKYREVLKILPSNNRKIN
jgi:RNA polymerase sigma-54 factor